MVGITQILVFMRIIVIEKCILLSSSLYIFHSYDTCRWSDLSWLCLLMSWHLMTISRHSTGEDGPSCPAPTQEGLTQWGQTKWTPVCCWYFQLHFFNEILWISIEISLKFVPKGPINNIPAMVQIMAWCRTGDKPLSEPMVAYVADAYMHHSALKS